MQINFRIIKATAAIAALLPLTAQAQTVNFDNLPSAMFGTIPVGYSGYNWFYNDGAFGSGTQLQYTNAGLSGATCVSGSQCAYNAQGSSSIRIESLTPSASSEFSLTAFLGDGGFPGFASGPSQVQISEFVGTSSTAFFTGVYSLSSPAGFTFIDLSANAYNKLLITPLDNSGNPLTFSSSAFSNGYVTLDDVTFAAAGTPTAVTPEPATLSLFGAGLSMVGLLGARKRRQRSA